MIKLSISGCLGRMGQSINRLASQDKEFEIHTLLEHKNHPQVTQIINNKKITSSNSDLMGSDVLIEFTSPEATMENLEFCKNNNIKLVIGTTGLNEDQINKIKEASKKISIVFSSNMSIGVNILFKLTQIVSEKSNETYKVTMSESHHIHKKDAPSGTAKTLASIVEKSSNKKVENIDSIREGEIIGDHSVFFESPEDIITISHHAKNRDIFAKGALVAAKFLSHKQNGLFDMQDVLGLK